MAVTKLKVNQLDTDSVGATQLIATAVTAGSYTAANITVDADGRLTNAANGTIPVLPTFVFNEVPAGTIDGTNPTFTTANTPTAGTLRIYKNGVRQRPLATFDYTHLGSTITFLTGNIPASGDSILVDYHY